MKSDADHSKSSKQKTKSDKLVKSMLDATMNDKSDEKYNFKDYVDEREFISHDYTGTKEMKIKILEVSDEKSASEWKFGNRVKVKKILVIIKHLDTQKVEEGEFDIEAIEKELIEKRHYISSNRWIHETEIKNGFIKNTRHTILISSANALDYITF